MKFKNTEVFNFAGALRGMRNPMNSWDKSDSGICKGGDNGIGCNNCVSYDCGHTFDHTFQIGRNDLELAQKLIKAGSDHSKFMRQIIVSVDITAPLYWYKEFDTYKVGTVANSTSTMHKLATTKITRNCFEFDSVEECDIDYIINRAEWYRQKYLETNDKRYWRGLIQLLSSAWFQTRTVTMSYQNVRAMSFARENHKLTEWSKDFVEWRKSLPYSEELIMYRGETFVS